MPHPITSFTSSSPMAQSPHFDEVSALGKKLVQELSLNDSVNTLERWMAHYIAELIHNAENAPADEKPALQAECAAAIMDLWEKRHSLPNGKRPFEDMESVFCTLEQLNTQKKTPFYYQSALSEAQEAAEKDSVKNLLDTALSIDHVAQMLIKYCLSEAASNAAEQSSEWVALARALDHKPDLDVKVVTRLLGAGEVPEKSTDHENLRREIGYYLENLEEFTKLLKKLEEHLREKLAASAID